MAQAFSISIADKAITLDARSRRGRVKYTVSHGLARAVAARADVVPEGSTQARWLAATPERQAIAQGGNASFVVEIAPSADAEAGNYLFHLRVVDDENPDDLSTEGPTASFEVPPPNRLVPPWRRWVWLGVAIAGLAATVAGGRLVYCRWLGTCGTGLHDPCAQDSECNRGLTCARIPGAAEKECRLAQDAACHNPGDCASYACREGKCASGSQPPPASYAEAKVRPDDPARGPADAKLRVVLFSDFQGAFDARLKASLERLVETFPGQVQVIWKHHPNAFIHPRAVPAALAAEAARTQGRFWPMHDKLFQDAQALEDTTFDRYAEELRLDVARFRQARAAREGEARIAEDQSLAQAVGVSGTPTMFLNCRRVVGAVQFEQLREVAVEELGKADALLAGKKPDAAFPDRACAANVAARR